jgi:hypothetical protein
MGNLALPREVVRTAEEQSLLINYLTPRKLVMQAIQQTYPGIRPENVHVWTLGGPSREPRIGSLWAQWREAGAHLIEDGWVVPETGMAAFTESGTYAPSFRIGPFAGGDGEPHLLLCDGYAASAEAMQAASLDPILGTETSMVLFSSRFEVPWEREHLIMHLDPGADDFGARLEQVFERPLDEARIEAFRDNLVQARMAKMPMGRRTIGADDFFPNKEWRVLALSSYMLPDPYTGAPGVEELTLDELEADRSDLSLPQGELREDERLLRVTTHACTRKGVLEVSLTFRLLEPDREMSLVFSPLLDRFYAGQDYRTRPVKVSDSGRIRNELQTLCSEALEPLPDDRIRVHLDEVDDAVLPPDKKSLIREVLLWYKQCHPFWFRWLEID